MPDSKYTLTKKRAILYQGVPFLRSVTVRVPLNSIAKEILERYKDCPFDELLPLISQQKYNVAIKKMFLEAGLTRPVVILILIQVNRKSVLSMR